MPLSDQRSPSSEAPSGGRHVSAARRHPLVIAVIAALLVLVIVAAWAVVFQLTRGGDHDTFTTEAEPGTRQVTFLDDRRAQLQHLAERHLQKEYDKTSHTLKNPFVELDPYDMMPLSALIMFDTSESARISVSVAGQNGDDPIEHAYDAYDTHHSVPVLGLYPDADNRVTLVATDENGDETGEAQVTITTDPLPDDFVQPELVTAQTDKMAEGLTFMIPTKKYIYAVDADATVRWYSSAPMKLAFERLENGHILFATREEGTEQYNELVEMDMLGKVYNDYYVEIDEYSKANVIHHDVVELPDGNLLATTHEPDSKYEQDQMIEIDRETGRTRRFISDRSIFPPSAYEDYTGKNAEDNDWVHQNAIWFDEASRSILISARSQDSIVKLSYPQAQIDWILAAHEDWPTSYEKCLLEPVGDVKYPAGQHAVKLLPDQDDDPDTVDILLFDNNTVITRGDADESDAYSRGVQYRIDEKKRTVEEVWSYGEDRGVDFFSDIIGNTQLLPAADNVLITSGAISPDDDSVAQSRVVEVSHDESAEVVFEVATPQFDREDGRYIYRSYRWGLYPDAPWPFAFGDTAAAR